MPLFNTTQTWAKNLVINGTHTQYVVQLKRQIYCCSSDKYKIFVNGEEIDHQLKYNPCSPLCGGRGKYEWSMDGHHFLLMFNSLSFTTMYGSHRLFIDGIDCNTDREFSAFWRRRGWQTVFMGVIMVLIGIILSLLYHYVHSVTYMNWILYLGYGLFVGGAVSIVYGIIPVLRYRKPLTYQNVVYDTSKGSVNQA